MQLSGATSWIIGGGGANIHIFVFTDHKNNRFQKKLIMQNTNYRAGGATRYAGLVLLLF